MCQFSQLSLICHRHNISLVVCAVIEGLLGDMTLATPDDLLTHIVLAARLILLTVHPASCYPSDTANSQKVVQFYAQLIMCNVFFWGGGHIIG